MVPAANSFFFFPPQSIRATKRYGLSAGDAAARIAILFRPISLPLH